MKALILKELRENFKIGAIGFVLFTLLVLGSGLSYSRFIDAVASGNRSLVTNWSDLHPLTSDFALAVPWFCAVFAVLLGWLQIHNEKYRDLWAFLIHRPVPRAHLFWAKVAAGLTTYLIAAGLPLFLFLVWISMPGQVAAPFEWAMIWPIAAWFLLGIVWYFAGMLTRIREARWYASRALGVGVALVATVAVLISWNRWQVTLVLIGCAALLALAVWGAFHSHGHYEPQPALGKTALTTSTTVGMVLVVLFGAILISYVFPGTLVQPSTQYVMLRDGAIYKQTYQAGGTFQLLDLQGNVLKDVRTLEDLQARQAGAYRLLADQQSNPRTPPFFFWDATPETIWFFWTRYGKLSGFDLRTRRFIGTLGPNGFSTGRSQSGDRFEMPWAFVPAAYGGDLHSATAVYLVDAQKRTVHPVFTTTTDDPVMAVSSGGVARSGARVFRVNTAVLTRRSLQLIGPDDQTIWRVPFEQPRKEYTDVTISVIDTNQFAVWVAPSNQTDVKNPGKFPVYVTWFSTNQNVLQKTELPPLSSVRQGKTLTLTEKLMSAVMPPAVMLILFPLMDQSIPWPMLVISLAIATLIFVPLGTCVGRRYDFSLRAQITWAVFHIFSGMPGILAFLAVHDWPAREPCPNCRKPRIVTREHCEHCAADFSAPPKDGTEIFEPLLSTSAR